MHERKKIAETEYFEELYRIRLHYAKRNSQLRYGSKMEVNSNG